MGLLAATYMEDGERMPIEMRAWLAGPLRAMGGVQPKGNGEPIEATRIATLGRALNIAKRQGSPRFVDRLFVRMGLPAIISGKQSETAFAKTVGKRFGVSLNIARNHIRREMAFCPGVEAREWMSDILAANGIEGLVEPRGGLVFRQA
jgi:hypothetical protein